MGGFKNLLAHFFKRPVKNWNIENRAFKLLEEQERLKPAVAPRHPTTVEKLDDLIKGKVRSRLSYRVVVVVSISTRLG